MKPRTSLSALALFFVSACLPMTVQADEHPLSEKARAELKAEFQERAEKASKQIEASPQSTGAYSNRGDARFFAGDFAGALADYEKMVELDPKLATSHWRRGIAYFYAKKYKEAANQFEIYHTYDDVDRENGIWRFFSQEKAYGLEKAKEGLLKYEKDDREPFPDVYRLFAEKITPEEILSRIAKADISDEEREKREFYAHLYIGLNHALHQRNERAKTHLAEAVKNEWGREAGYGPSYMWHVGRVHYDLLDQQEPAADTPTAKRPTSGS